MWVRMWACMWARMWARDGHCNGQVNKELKRNKKLKKKKLEQRKIINMEHDAMLIRIQLYKFPDESIGNECSMNLWSNLNVIQWNDFQCNSIKMQWYNALQRR